MASDILMLIDKAAARQQTDRQGLVAYYRGLDPDYADRLAGIIQREEAALKDQVLDSDTALL